MADPTAVGVTCTINGRKTRLEGHPMTRLLDGTLVNSCLTPLVHASGASITTIEGVAAGNMLHEVQEAFLEHGGAQCGICTPGMVLAAIELLTRAEDPTEDDVRIALAGNLCRCTGYMRIFESVLEAAKRR